ncbi:cupin domain-containing protein [Antarctobacter jejuensis]|uniref:cupin domain-containing protein n=1 Tax=Antarctobacter jejuensis TaxID=1439938 RepID=UPI003FD69800
MFRTALTIAALMMIAAPVVASDLVKREILQDQPVSDAEDLKLVLTRVTVMPGGRIEKHAHPGDEHAVVLTGGPVEMADGSGMTLAEGQVLFYSAGEVHGGVINTGAADIVLLTTHVVNIYEPFRWAAE